LRRARGNNALYVDLLRQFAERHGDSAARIEAALEAKDGATAERIAHTVKGVAGSLGLGALAATAGELERALRAGEDSRGASASFEAALASAVAALRSALAPARSAPLAPAETATARRDAARLAELLAAADGEALDHFQSASAALRPLLGESDFAAISRAVGDYDFESGLARLREAAARVGIELPETTA
jgi:HPt (histidine-containing phosphotransfer) domain-containing protein